MSDGLVSNVSLVLGFAGAMAAPSTIRLAGLAGLLAGAFSMAAGEYISMQAQTELLEGELDYERRQLREDPEWERQELSAIYQRRGIDASVAEAMSTEVMKDFEVALEVHAREELGIDPDDLGSPFGAMFWSFLTFALGAAIPLVPWFFWEGNGAMITSIAATSVAAVALGAVVGQQSGKGPYYAAFRQLLVSALAAAVTFLVGTLVGH